MLLESGKKQVGVVQLVASWIGNLTYMGCNSGVVSLNPWSSHILFSSPEPKAQGELIVWDSSRRLSVRASLHPSTLSNMNISKNQPANHNQISSEASLGWGSFGPDQIRTLVSMATDSSHRVIMGKIL